MQHYLGMGTVATAIGLVLTVWAWKMNAQGANWMLVAAWLLFAATLFFSVDAIADRPPIPRTLWAGLGSALIGLLLYYFLWTETSLPRIAGSEDAHVYVECGRTDLPTKVSASDNLVSIIDTDTGAVIRLMTGINDAAVVHHRGAGEIEIHWDRDQSPWAAALCRLRNDSSEPLSKVVVTVSVRFQEMIRDPTHAGTYTGGAVRQEYTQFVELPRIRPQSEATIYLINDSPSKVAIADITDAGGSVVVSSGATRTLRFIRPDKYRGPFNLDWRRPIVQK